MDEDRKRPMGDCLWWRSVLWASFSVQTLLVGWHEGHPAWKAAPLIHRHPLVGDPVQPAVTWEKKDC